MAINPPRFVISLDFELMWGVRDNRTVDNYGKNIIGARKAIVEMLKLFAAYDISATFATVGFLFCETKEEVFRYIPTQKPTYTKQIQSPYSDNFIDVGDSEESDPYHFAASIIKLIATDHKHEIACHTFSHYYCLEPGQTKDQFSEDLQSAIKLAASKNIILKSIVFPRNQYNHNYLDLCIKNGITHYRGNPQSWLYDARSKKSESQGRRMLRFIDSYINLSGHHTYNMKENSELVTNVPASRFLRPYSPKLFFLERLKINRIKKSMTVAAVNNEMFHLWWHPHNFGNNTVKNLAQLEDILKHYVFLREKYSMISVTMQEL